jgi:hypothetical protein
MTQLVGPPRRVGRREFRSGSLRSSCGSWASRVESGPRSAIVGLGCAGSRSLSSGIMAIELSIQRSPVAAEGPWRRVSCCYRGSDAAHARLTRSSWSRLNVFSNRIGRGRRNRGSNGPGLRRNVSVSSCHDGRLGPAAKARSMQSAIRWRSAVRGWTAATEPEGSSHVG